MPDLGSESDSSGVAQAAVHPLHGPRRQSMRLRQPAVQATVASELHAYGTDPVVLLPLARAAPAVAQTNDEDDSELQAMLDDLDQELGLAASHSVTLPPERPAAPALSPNPFREVTASPARSLSLVMPSVQRVQDRPNLRTVKGVSVLAAVIRNLYGLKVSNVIGTDGNCMFRAMAYHLTGNQDLHMEVRMKAINWLQRNPGILAFAAHGDGHFSAATYLANMAKPGMWGDEIMIMAIAQAYDVSIMVYSGRDPQTGEYHATTYPHNATGPHCGLWHLTRSQHYELLFP